MSHPGPDHTDASDPDRAYRDSFKGLPFAVAPATLGAGQAVRIRVMCPFDLLLAFVLHTDPGSSAMPAELPLATAGDSSDLFAQLESEMVTDRLAQALASRSEDARRTVARVLASGGGRGVDTVVSLEDAQALLEWLNRMYVLLRTAELEAAGAPAAAGQAQSPALFLGLDAADREDGAEMPAEEADAEFSVPALLFALMTDMLATALDDLGS